MQNNTQRRVAVLCAGSCASKYAKQQLFISLLASSQISEGEGGVRAIATPAEAVQYQACSSARSEAVRGGGPCLGRSGQGEADSQGGELSLEQLA